MPELFDVTDLLRVAVQDEKTGAAFYTAMSQKAANPNLRETFAAIAQQEKGHQQRFEKMLQACGGASTREEYSGQYIEYLRAMTSQRAFADEPTAVNLAQKCQSDLAAVDLALRTERDTILLMLELRQLAGDANRQIVDDVIREEQTHLVTLTEARRIAR